MNRKNNLSEHSTIYYDIPGLVLRRGKKFSFIITFNQAYQNDKHHLSVMFKSQIWQNIPIIKIPLNSSFNGWSTKVITNEDQNLNNLHLQIISPPDTLIGKYSVNIKQKKISFFIFCIFLYFNSFYLKYVQLKMV